MAAGQVFIGHQDTGSLARLAYPGDAVRIFAPLVASACCVLGAAGLFSLSLFMAETPLILLGAALSAGLLVGSEGDIMPFLTRRYFGVAGFGAIFGCVIGIAAMGGIIGPLAFGRVFDATGTYVSVLRIAATACAASGFAILLLGPYRYPATAAAINGGELPAARVGEAR